MTAEVIFRSPQSDLAYLSHWLLATGRRVMPIVDDDHRLVGVVTRGDLHARARRAQPSLEPPQPATAVAGYRQAVTRLNPAVHGGVDAEYVQRRVRMLWPDRVK